MVDYSSLENYRTERYRGFESLSLRHLMKREPYGFPFFVSVHNVDMYCEMAYLPKDPEIENVITVLKLT